MPNGLRYPQVDGTRQGPVDGKCSSTESTPFDGANSTCRVHAMLGVYRCERLAGKNKTPLPTCPSFTHNRIFGNYQEPDLSKL